MTEKAMNVEEAADAWMNETFDGDKTPAKILKALIRGDVIRLIKQERAAHAAAIAEREWRPIETAPKDGTAILLAVIGEFGVGCVEHGRFEVLQEDEDDGPWDLRGGEPFCTYVGRSAGTYWNCWFSTTEYENRYRVNDCKDFKRFSHWMPLPPIPTPTEGGK